MVTRTRLNVKLNVHCVSCHRHNLLQNSHIDALPRTDFLLAYRFTLIFIFTYKPIYMYVHNTVNKTLMCPNILISWWRQSFSRSKKARKELGLIKIGRIKISVCDNFTYSLSAVHYVTVGDSTSLQLLPN